MLVRGYGFGVEDQVLYLPFLEHWNNPALFPHDYLLSLSWAKDSFVWPGTAFLGRLTGLPVVFFLLQAAATLAGLYVIHRTALLLWGDRRVAWLAVLLWIPSYEIPGAGVSTFDAYFTARSIGVVMAAASIYLFLRGREGAATLLLAAVVFIHVLDVFPPAAGMTLALLLERRWKPLGRLVAVMGSAGAVLLLYAHLVGARHDLWMMYSGETFQFLWRKLPDLFPQGWPFSTWLGLGLYLTAAVLAFFVHLRKGALESPERRLFAVALGAALAALAGMAGAWCGVALLAQLSLVRGVLWVLYLLVLWSAAEVLRWLEDPSLGSKFAGLFLVTTWLTGAAGAHAIVTAVLAARASSAETAADPGAVRFPPIRWPVVSALLVLAALEAYWMLAQPRFGFSREPSGLPAAGIVLVFAGLASLFRSGGPPAARPLFLGACTTAVFLLLPTVSMMRLLPDRPLLAGWVPGLAASYERLRAEEATEASYSAMAALVKRIVPPEATVIVSPRWMTFRLQAKRSSFVTFKDRCGMLYSQRFADEWVRRMRLIGAYREGDWVMDDSLPLTREELVRLSRIYAGIHLDYVVTRREYDDLPELGRAGGFRLYALRESPPGAGP